MRWALVAVLIMGVCAAQEPKPKQKPKQKKRLPSRDETLRQSYRSLWEKTRACAVWVRADGKQVAGGALVEPGWVATSLAALGEKRTFEVVDVGGNRAPAHLVGVDLLYDVALLKVDGALPAAKPVRFGSEFLLRKGHFVFTVAPELSRFHVSVVSELGRNIARLPEQTLRRLKVMGILSDEFRGARRSYCSIIQHDGRMPPADRGLPLLDSAGRMVGLNIELVFRGVALAAPVTRLKDALPRLKRGYVLAAYPYLGFRGRTLREESVPQELRNQLEPLRQKAEAPAGWGVEVTSVRTGGPADKAGLKVGDIITAVDYAPLWSLTDFRRRFAHMLPGMKVRFRVWRGGKMCDLLVEVGKRKPRVLRLVLGKVDEGAARAAVEEARRILCAVSVETLKDDVGLTLLVRTAVPRSALKRHLRFAKTVLKDAR